MYSNTNSKLPKIYARQKLMKKSYLEVLSEARKGVSKASPLKTLIELNRERKLRERREKILKHLRPYKIKTGTLIMGVRCKDGVVIGSDRKIIRGGETSYSDKIFTFDVGGKKLIEHLPLGHAPLKYQLAPLLSGTYKSYLPKPSFLTGAISLST